MSKKKRPTPVLPESIGALFDSHTHLASTIAKGAQEGQDRRAATAELVARAGQAGVERICTVGDGLAETELALEAAQQFDNVWAACAIHPTRADELDEAAKARLTDMAANDRCVAIGETGLDAYWIKHDESTPSLEVQEAALRWHIDLAVNSGKPLMIHNREADEDLMRILADAPQPNDVILHCFSSPLEVAREAIDRGYVLSFAGNATFKRNDELREAARLAPADQILVETDAPYMTPEPFRGACNEPGFVGYTARVLAEARGQSPAEFVELAWANANRVFGLQG
ncbi:TatD family hydrolase [Corynebacterium urealyticum]|uniref:Putative deoxyribonuclease n=1 Tax=Corynebacterium urealyticum (strain ATCC 43042 / DSM 7109) TaxID=504474 RepID=B1VFI2_CORU7|nr:TatD family hydrolase [Corynebacterium urealyticum]AGE36137.1 putative deoxyribonuclease [Corynebacterium urealyticum DSM 7111]QQB07815.1 TatD family hydrolase [Corynebacterium urealyticum]QQC41987.1 TatD family hydrolase [Corynebacterium urealyticum]QQE50611.1 TatD family hydrolase [Corynebacterium urealyticum]TYR17929.1 TatD family deoxyribonuclease [Corynebacterium urealyticum]